MSRVMLSFGVVPEYPKIEKIAPKMTFISGLACCVDNQVEANVRKEMLEEIPKDKPVGFILQHTGRADMVLEMKNFIHASFNVKFVLLAYLSSNQIVHSGPYAKAVAWIIDPDQVDKLL